MTDEPKKLRGFAAMTPEKRQAAQRKGGLKAVQTGQIYEVNFQGNPERAKTAGKKGNDVRWGRG